MLLHLLEHVIRLLPLASYVQPNNSPPDARQELTGLLTGMMVFHEALHNSVHAHPSHCREFPYNKLY